MSLSLADAPPTETKLMKKRRYGIVGTGARVVMFLDPIVSRFQNDAEVVGLCDKSPVRMKFHQERVAREYAAPQIPAYRAEDFDKMILEQKPDSVIVCAPDHLHHEYIVRALDHGLDVISEKPITTDASKCRDILDAVQRTGRSVRTTFNMRWMPGPTKVRKLIQSGAIGNVKHVQFEYMINTSHGADYFRRWHSEKQYSGGLLVHKSTHHFDLINWWTDAIPELVYAMGDLVFYGKQNAIARGLEASTRYPRYTGVKESEGDPFRLDLKASDRNTQLYFMAEEESGYIRDRNVFRDGITIEDSMSVLIRYRNGIMANYSLNAYCPIEGLNVSISGDGGRIEYTERKYPIVQGGNGNGHSAKEPADAEPRIRVIPLFTHGYDVPVETYEGGHGGSDPLVQEQIFSSTPPPEELGRNAGHEQGVASVLIGAAANQSIATGGQVKISDLVSLNPAARHFHELI